MSPKSVSFLAIALVAILAAPVMSAVADADAGQSSGFYRDQLDANGQGLYDEVGATLAALEEAPVNEVKVSYTMSSVPSTEADAVSYAQSVVSDALAALYLSDPSYVWLWDYPISNVAIGTSSFDPASGTISVTFSLAVPDRYADDPETEANELAETIADFRGKIEAFEGDALSVVQSVNNVLRDTRVSDDQEATEEQPADTNTYTDDMSIEEITQRMSVDEARSIVVTFGTCKGWTLGEVMDRRASSLRFYLYSAKDAGNVLKAAASLLLDELAMKKAG